MTTMSVLADYRPPGRAELTVVGRSILRGGARPRRCRKTGHFRLIAQPNEIRSVSSSRHDDVITRIDQPESGVARDRPGSSSDEEPTARSRDDDRTRRPDRPERAREGPRPSRRAARKARLS